MRMIEKANVKGVHAMKESLGWTIKKLSRELGVSQDTVKSWLRAESSQISEPTYRLLAILHKYKTMHLHSRSENSDKEAEELLVNQLISTLSERNE